MDPTDVLGRRIGAYLFDVLLFVFIAVFVGAIFWLSSSHLATDGAGKHPANCKTFNADTQRYGAPSNATCIDSSSEVRWATDSDTQKAIDIGGITGLLIPINLFLIQGFTGASIGKRLFGLRVVLPDGSIAGFGKNALRTLMLVFDAFFITPIVGLVAVSVTHPRRRLGDMAASTYVIGKANVGRPVVVGTWPQPTGDAATAGGSQIDPSEPHWDADRNAWIAWEPTRGQWMQFDADKNEWRVM